MYVEIKVLTQEKCDLCFSFTWNDVKRCLLKFFCKFCGTLETLFVCDTFFRKYLRRIVKKLFTLDEGLCCVLHFSHYRCFLLPSPQQLFIISVLIDCGEVMKWHNLKKKLKLKWRRVTENAIFFTVSLTQTGNSWICIGLCMLSPSATNIVDTKCNVQCSPKCGQKGEMQTTCNFPTYVK